MPNHRDGMKMWSKKTHIWRAWEPRRLVFFVHGFGGVNTEAWLQFPPLMLDDDVFRNDDLLFFGYESKKQGAIASASILFQYCDDFLSRPEQYLTANDYPRPADFKYDQIIFVSHSLGAPVVRYMMLKALDEGAAWLSKASLVFFAPVTQGARAEALLSSLVSWRPSGVVALASLYFRFRWPVISDLKVGSAFLQDLYKRTYRRLGEGHMFLNSRQTYFAGEEHIIETGEPELPFDKPSYYFVGRDHNDVCKPEGSADPVYEKFARLIDGIR